MFLGGSVRAPGPVSDNAPGHAGAAFDAAVAAVRKGTDPVQAAAGLYGRRAVGERAGERALVGFAAVAVPAGGCVEVEVACSLDPLAIWNPQTRQLDPPARTTVALGVAGHAHDPAALALQVGLP
jgi:beta-glucosidase